MHTENLDVTGEKYIRADDGNLSLEDESGKLAWKQHYKWLLNIGFLWSYNASHVDLVAGPAQFIPADNILKSLRLRKNGKVVGPSAAAAETLKAVPDIWCEITADLMNPIRFEGMASTDWSDSIIVSSFKGTEMC